MAVSTVLDDAVPSSVRDVGSMGARAFTELPKDSQLDRQEGADVHELVDEYRSTECTCLMTEIDRCESLSSSARRLGIEDRNDGGCDVASSSFESGVLDLDPSWRSKSVVTGTAEISVWMKVEALPATIEPSKSNEEGLTSWLSAKSSYARV
jgi:hypothetical protein